MRLKSSRATADRSRTKEGTTDSSGGLFTAGVVLARRGRYREAAKLLQSALDAGECSVAEALDLQARMYAQQGLYLHAESCWQRAKQSDGSNPAYDEALTRLRTTRHPTGRFLQGAAALSAVVILGLLVWQIAFVNPRFVEREIAAEGSLAGIREDVARFDDASQGRDQELATTIKSLETRLSLFESRLSERLKSLPTASRIAQDHDTLIARLDDQIATLQKVFEREVGSLRQRRAEADTEHTKRIEAVVMAISNTLKETTSLERKLSERVEAGDVSLTKRLDAIEDSFRREMESLVTSVEATALGQAMCGLQDQFAEMSRMLKDLRATPDKNVTGADDGQPTEQPKPKERGQQP